MKALSIIQPHAELIRIGLKLIETRSWCTNYRGEILIHASKTKIPKAVRQNAELLSLIEKDISDLDYGYIIAKAKLVGCEKMTSEFIAKLKKENPTEFVAGYYSEGRYAWFLECIKPIEPIAVKGHLGIWDY